MRTPDTYPMPLFVSLDVTDLATSQRWYEAIGFKTVFALVDPAGVLVLAHMRWIRYADVLLRPATGLEGTKGLGLTLNFMVEHDIDALAAHAKSVGALVHKDVGDRPWNARDFTLLDPDGFALTFTFGPVKRRDFDDVIRESLKS